MGWNIYTKKGDTGQTTLADGTLISKASDYTEAVGTIDELNSYLGLCLQYIEIQEFKKKLHRIQQQLIKINSVLALARNVEIIKIDSLQNLELEIDALTSKLEPIDSFILPGGSLASAQLDVARTICRRAERAVVKLNNSDHTVVIAYLNRLSDWLFVLARFLENTNATQ